MSAELARRALAAAVLPARAAHERLGTVVLFPHQRALAALAAARVARWGGVLVSEPPGWGKTFTALAAVDASEGAVVAPAALREPWRDALARAGRHATFVSVESLSRRRAALAPRWVIVDEAHHLRNPNTRRYDAAAALCLFAPVILLTATPIQNRRDDLAAQLALFLGEGAFDLPMAALATHVLRSAASSAPALPSVADPEWLHLPSEDAWLERIVNLPAAVPPADGGAADALERYTLVRQWASSRAALVGALRRRLGASLAMEDSLAAGAAPTRRDLATWEVDGDVLQPAFPGLVVAARAPAGARTPPSAAALRRVRRHVRALRMLLGALTRAADPDAERARMLVDLLARHAGSRIVAFSAFAETVASLARQLRAVPGVAWVTASGAHIVSGALPRDELLRQFGAQPGRVPAAERVGLLVTTDVLSEGLDLQGASVVVHLDLPWNPARLEQRVGRLRRIGAPGDRVVVYAFAPPADAERLLGIEQRLRAKLATAATLGRGMAPILPLASALAAGTPAGEADLEAAIVARLEGWARRVAGDGRSLSPCAADGRGALRSAQGELDDRSTPDRRGAPFALADDDTAMLIAAVHAPVAGWVAVVGDDGCGGKGRDPALVGDLGDGPTDARAVVARALELAEGPAAEVTAEGAAEASVRLAAWKRGRRGRRLAASGDDGPLGETRRHGARRLAALVAGLDRPSRIALAPRISHAREALARRAGIGFDRRIAALAAERDDARWLDAISAEAEGAPRAAARDLERGVAVNDVLILLVATAR